MSDFKITNVNFIIPILSDEGKELKVYVPQPLESELRGIARVLGEIYAIIKSKRVEFEVFLKDCDIFVEEILERLENADIKRKAVDAFIARSLLNASVYTTDGDKLEKLSPDEELMFRSALVFISALYRYTMRQILMNELQDFFTSQTNSEFQGSLRKSQDPSIPEDAAVVKRA